MSERKHPDYRSHDDYNEDHWKVLDVDRVDKVFATGLKSEDNDAPVRIDFDGFAAQSVMRDLADEGDDVNVSAWLSVEQAEDLRDRLTDAIERAEAGYDD